MDGYLKQQAVQLALEQLMKTPAGEKFQQAVQLIQSMQEHLTALSEKEEAASVTGVKAATVLTLGVLKKIAGREKSVFLRCRGLGRTRPYSVGVCRPPRRRAVQHLCLSTV